MTSASASASDRPSALSPELATRALQTARAIGETLRPLSGPEVVANPWRTAELTLLYTYLAQHWPDYETLAQELVDRLVDEMGDATLDASLYGGFPGMAFIYQQVTGPDGEDIAESIDAALAETLHTGWSGDYDLINGLVGLGIYTLERLPRPSARRVLTLIVQRLVQMASEEPSGLTWRTPERRVNVNGRAQVSYDLGVAHGVPGAIALLAAALNVGLTDARVPLEAAMRWVWATRLPPDAVSCFPIRVEPGVPVLASRAAWCYGDPGVATALFTGARALGHAPWQEQAIEVARHAASCSLEASAVVDAGLCHGSAGLVHLFGGFHRATGEALFADATRRWTEQTLAFARPGIGLAGYQSLDATPPDFTTLKWRDDGSFLTGVAGIALALFSTVNTLDPGWDRLLIPRMPQP